MLTGPASVICGMTSWEELMTGKSSLVLSFVLPYSGHDKDSSMHDEHMLGLSFDAALCGWLIRPTAEACWACTAHRRPDVEAIAAVAWDFALCQVRLPVLVYVTLQTLQKVGSRKKSNVYLTGSCFVQRATVCRFYWASDIRWCDESAYLSGVSESGRPSSLCRPRLTSSLMCLAPSSSLCSTFLSPSRNLPSQRTLRVSDA